jgi:hypothetical protein
MSIEIPSILSNIILLGLFESAMGAMVRTNGLRVISNSYAKAYCYSGGLHEGSTVIQTSDQVIFDIPIFGLNPL